MQDLKKLIREVPDFPKPGILFYDITTLLKDRAGLAGVIDGLKDHYRHLPVDVVLGIEARGFIFAPALAYALGAGFVPIRKPKKLPAEVVSVSYDLEYGKDSLEMHKDAVNAGTPRAHCGRPFGHRRHGGGGGQHGAGKRRHRGGTRLRGGAHLPERASETGRERRVLPAAIRPMSGPRRVRVRALAKLNLDLRVLGKRPDGYHELRTIFQTISLADSLEIAFTPGRKTVVELQDSLAIPDNLVTRAAHLAMEAMGAGGCVEIRLTKRIPMGAGLGGGSSDAAAVLLALPVLAGRKLDLAKLSELGQQLGSDVPFFLLGGTAVGIGRGTNSFPSPMDRRSSAWWWPRGCMSTPPRRIAI
jgi:hypothetical protein